MIANIKNKLIWIGTSSIVSLLFYIQYPVLFYFLIFFGYSGLLVFSVVNIINKREKDKGNNKFQIEEKTNKFDSPQHQSPAKKFNDEVDSVKNEFSPIFEENCLDECMQRVISESLHAFFDSWIDNIIYEDQDIVQQLKKDLWHSLVKINTRLRQVNLQKLITIDFIEIVKDHLEKSSNRVGFIEKEIPLFDDEIKEMSYLKKISEILIMLLFPREYCVSPLRVMFCEIFAYKFLYSNIKTASDPDFLNQKMIEFIKHKMSSEKSFGNDGSILSISKIVDKSTTIDDLLLIRSSLLNDLFQALTINQDSSLKLFAKNRNNGVKLKEYIRNLSSIKYSCEEKLEQLGLPDLSKYNLTLKDILSTVIGRKFFSSFIKSPEAKSLIALHFEIGELIANTKSGDKLQENAKILHTYLMNLKEFNFENDICDHDSFVDIQKKIRDLLEEKYYHPFVINSKEYEKLSNLLELTMTESQKSPLVMEEILETGLIKFYVGIKNSLCELREALNLNERMYEILSMLPDINISLLKIKIEELMIREKQIEKNLNDLENWLSSSDNMRILSVDTKTQEKGQFFKILMKIDMKDNFDNNSENDHELSDIQINIIKNLDQIRQFNEELQLPIDKLKSTKMFNEDFLELLYNQNDKDDKKSIDDKTKCQFKEYFNFILDDHNLQESEKTFKFFNSMEIDVSTDDENDQEIETSNDMENSKVDPIIEKIFNVLLNETNIDKYFDGKSLRKKYIFSVISNAFNCKWKETSEFRNNSTRNDDQKEASMKLVKDLILEKIPDSLNIYNYQKLLHQKSLLKIFNTFQSQNYNKKLIYDLLELLLYEIFPEMQKIQQTMSKT